MSVLPYAFIDVDGVLQASSMKYGYEVHRVIVERIPRELVHPTLIPRGNPRSQKKTIIFRTPVRTSPRLLDDLAALPVDPIMLTTWLEHDSVDQFFAQTGVRDLPGRRNLVFPGRTDDGSLPWGWKYDLLTEVLRADPRPFIWADDDEVPKFRERVESDFPHLPKLLIAPIESIGLTPYHVDQMREFLSDRP